MAGEQQTPLPQSFYLDPPEVVARKLLGKLIVRRRGSDRLVGRIVETEAYLGLNDPASHAFRGPTARNEVMFGPPGRAYVYFIYGVHYCLNVCCEPEGTAGCVLIRALEPVEGLRAMRQLRKLPEDAPARLLTSGPGKLCQALDIVRLTHNGTDLTSSSSDLQVMEGPVTPFEIAMTPRIGISKAAEMPLRFLIAGNKFVSASRAKNVSSAG